MRAAAKANAWLTPARQAVAACRWLARPRWPQALRISVSGSTRVSLAAAGVPWALVAITTADKLGVLLPISCATGTVTLKRPCSFTVPRTGRLFTSTVTRSPLRPLVQPLTGRVSACISVSIKGPRFKGSSFKTACRISGGWLKTLTSGAQKA